MKQGWEIKKLGDICSIQLGKTPYRKNPKFWDKEKLSGNVWLSISDLKHGEYISESAEQVTDLGAKEIVKIPKGTMLLSFKLTLGRVSFAGTDLYTNEVIAALLNLNKKISKDFLFYYFSLFDWDKAAEGDVKVKGKTLNKQKLKELQIPLPPLPEQQRIVSILDEAFSVIERSRNNAEQNLKNAKELFESYLQGVFGGSTGSPTKRDGWEEKTLGEVCEIDPKKSEIKGLENNNIVSFLPMKDLGVLQNTIIPIQTRKLSEVIGSYTYFRNNDILLAKVTPCFENGKLGIAKNLKNGIGFGSSEYIVFRPLNIVISDYIFYILSSTKFREEGRKLMFGACGLKRLSKDYVRTFLVQIPSLNEQQSIVHQLDALRAETQKLEAVYHNKLEDLEELKKSVLQKAFNGEL